MGKELRRVLYGVWEEALPWYRDQEVLFYTDAASQCVYEEAHIDMIYELKETTIKPYMETINHWNQVEECKLIIKT